MERFRLGCEKGEVGLQPLRTSADDTVNLVSSLGNDVESESNRSCSLMQK